MSSISEQKELKNLVQRVDSLEHKLAFLQLKYEMSSINSELTMSGQELRIKAQEIIYFINEKLYDKETLKSDQEYYKKCLETKQIDSELIEALKDVYILSMIKYQFSETERRQLLSLYNTMPLQLKRYEVTLDLFKKTLDMYDNR